MPFTSSPGVKDRPSFSPDGKEIAFAWQGESVDGSAFHIYVQMLGTGSGLQLTRSQGSDGSPVWSPDGRFIAFTRDSNEGSSVFIVPALGGPERKVVTRFEERFGSGLSWSTDGKYLAVADCTSEKGQAAANAAYDPSIAPYGNRLAFVSKNSDSNIWKVPLFAEKTAQPVKIIASTTEDSEPSNSPDGQRIVFGSKRSGSLEIYVSAADGSSVVQLTSMKSDTGSPRWSPD